jgi:hypothetical protein
MTITHFAVEVLFRETPIALAQEINQAAEELGYKFKDIEYLDTIQVGSNPFHRFRLALDPTRLQKLLDVLHSQKRSVIGPSDGGFEVRMKTGKKGSVSLTTILATARTPKMLRGPGDPNWRLQSDPIG